MKILDAVLHGTPVERENVRRELKRSGLCVCGETTRCMEQNDSSSRMHEKVKSHCFKELTGTNNIFITISSVRTNSF